MGVRLFQPDGKNHSLGSGKSALFIALRPCFPAVKAVLRPAYRGDGNLYIRRIGAVRLIGKRGRRRGEFREVHRDALWRPVLIIPGFRHLCIKGHARSRCYALKYIFLLPFAVISHTVDCSLCGRHRVGIGLPVIGITPAYVRHFTSGRFPYCKCPCHRAGIIPFPGDGDGCCPCVLMIAVGYREVTCGKGGPAVGNVNPGRRRPGTHCHRRPDLGAGISISPCHLRYRYTFRIQVPLAYRQRCLHRYAVIICVIRLKDNGYFRCSCGWFFVFVCIADSPCTHKDGASGLRRAACDCHFSHALPVGSRHCRSLCDNRQGFLRGKIYILYSCYVPCRCPFCRICNIHRPVNRRHINRVCRIGRQVFSLHRHACRECIR